MPDVLVLDKPASAAEPLWRREATITQGSSVRVVVEVVSAHWETDYARKAEDYEEMSIAEYWIVGVLDCRLSGAWWEEIHWGSKASNGISVSVGEWRVSSESI